MQNQNQTQPRKMLWAVAALVAAVAVAAALYFAFGPKGAAGQKTITVDVVQLDGAETVHTITTEAEFLRGALEQEGIIAGEESDYGLFVTTVDGVTADDSQEQWWCFTKAARAWPPAWTARPLPMATPLRSP